MDGTPLTIMADYNTAYTIGYWAIPVLLVIWVIIKIAVKAKGGKEDKKDPKKKGGTK